MYMYIPCKIDHTSMPNIYVQAISTQANALIDIDFLNFILDLQRYYCLP